MEESKKKNGISRRDFLKVAGTATAGLMASSLLPNSVFGAPASAKILGTNDKIRIAVLGVGGMGRGHLNNLKKLESEINLEVVAVCDVFEKRRLGAQQLAQVPDEFAVSDYRKILDMKDVDAVLIASTDHWHAQMAIDAMESGKHVYVEKPMTRYLDEAWKMYDVAKKTGAVVQVGSQGCTDAKWHTAGKAVAEGKIGTVLTIQGSYCRNNPKGEWNYDIDPEFTEDKVDWKKWLGPAENMPFSPEHYFRWRKFWPFGNGIIGDLWPHRLHPLMIATNITEFPTKVTCLGENVMNTDEGIAHRRDVADSTMMIAQFPSGAMLYLLGSTVNEQGLPDLIRGNMATVYFGGGKVEIRPERPFTDIVEPEDIPVLGPGESHIEHVKNWINAIRTNTTPSCDIELGIRVQTIVSMAEESYRKNKTVTFDPQTRKMS
ncbi:MAG: Gfo/Idh/MocA family oxidoreductase [Armatimonadota bacterium]